MSYESFMPEKAAKAALVEALPKKRQMVKQKLGSVIPKGVGKPEFFACSSNQEVKVKTKLNKERGKFVGASKKSEMQA